MKRPAGQVIPAVQNLRTFCARCGAPFVPFRKYHRRCARCA